MTFCNSFRNAINDNCSMAKYTMAQWGGQMPIASKIIEQLSIEPLSHY